MGYNSIRIFLIVAVLSTLSNGKWINTSSNYSKIFGGTDAIRTQQRYNVWIRLNDVPICGGSLIHEEWVLTAASCIDGLSKRRFYRIFIGDFNRKTESNEFKTKPKAFVLHPDYNSTTLESNIALIQLERPAPTRRKTISLVPQLSTAILDIGLTSNPDCFLTGWGQKTNGDPVKRLQVLPVNVLDSCSVSYDNTTELCYQSSTSSGGACASDEGDPVMCTIGGTETQVGLHSRTLCTTASTTSTRISAFISWIMGIINPVTVDCGVPPSITDGSFQTTGTMLGDTATLVCNADFRLSSASVCDSTITCQVTGAWSTTSVTCVPECSSVGTTFMFGYLQNAFGGGDPYLYITATTPTTVTIQIPFLTGDDTVLDITKYAAVKFANSLTANGNQEQSNKGVYISATAPISVYAHHFRTGDGPSADGTLIFPIDCLSSNYRTVSHNSSPLESILGELIVVATTDSTSVTVTQASGTVTNVVLNRFGTYQLRATDLTGTAVSSSQAVTVIAGHECGSVPNSGTVKCDHLIEQMPPESSLQTAYIVTSLQPRPNFSLRIVAILDSTDITIWDDTGASIVSFTLNTDESDFRTFTLSQTISITSNKAILVAQYGHGNSSDSLNFGDPSMVVIPGLNQFLNSYKVYTPSPQALYNRNWVVMILSDCYDTSGLRLNGAAVSTVGAKTITVPSIGTFTVIYAELLSGENSVSHIDSAATVGVVQYGFNNLVEYAWVPGRVL